MSTRKTIVLGTLVGFILSSLTLGAAFAVSLILNGQATISGLFALSTLINGTVLGLAGVSLSYLTTGRERNVLILLIGIATAALSVMVGSYDDGSLLPLGIYALAIMNSQMISRVTAALINRSNTATEPYLRG